MMDSASAQSPSTVSVDGLCKSFPGVVALDHVSLTFASGEVTAVLGENGAGKSTLMKILAGVQGPDQGAVTVGGLRVDSFTPSVLLEKYGVALVPQEIALCADRTVAENVLMGREGGMFPSRRRMNAEAKRLLAEVDSDIPPRKRAGDLTVAEQQMLLIVRALARDCRVLVLDEPTTSLTPHETTRLFDLLLRLRDAGKTIIYVSHRLPEIFAISGRIHVLRDGKHVVSYDADAVDPDTLIAAMVGRELGASTYHERDLGDDALLQLRNLTGPGFTDISFEVRRKQVVGVAGLPDSGNGALVAALFGAIPSTGEMHLGGARVRPRSPRDAMRAGIGYVPAERRTQGLFPDFTVLQNATVLDVESTSRFGLLRPRKLRRIAAERLADFDVRGTAVGSITKLSGGNQQKVIISRWLARKPRLLLLDDPTRGVDVGAKAEIHERIIEAADQGAAVVMSSSDLPELLRVCDRIAVLARGRLAGILDRAEATEEKIMKLATTAMPAAG